MRAPRNKEVVPTSSRKGNREPFLLYNAQSYRHSSGKSITTWLPCISDLAQIYDWTLLANYQHFTVAFFWFGAFSFGIWIQWLCSKHLARWNSTWDLGIFVFELHLKYLSASGSLRQPHTCFLQLAPCKLSFISCLLHRHWIHLPGDKTLWNVVQITWKWSPGGDELQLFFLNLKTPPLRISTIM